jgi:site-specific recombinase XerD
MGAGVLRVCAEDQGLEAAEDSWIVCAVDLSPACVEALRLHRKQQSEARLSAGPAWVDHDLIFPNATGGVIDPSTVARLYLHRMLEDAGLRRLRSNELRHSIATHLLDAGFGTEFVQDHLGHVSIQNMLNYARLTDRRRE